MIVLGIGKATTAWVACHKKWIHQMETGDKNQKKSRERIINDRKMKKAHFIHKSP
jgi:hypothetical protein